MNKRSLAMACCLALAALGGCGNGEPVAADRYAGPDRLFDAVEANVAAAPGLLADLEIDHSRLAAAKNEPMPPSRVLLFSSPDLDRALLAENRLAALDLPLRVLAFESTSDRQARLIANSFAYVAGRHGLPRGSEAEAAYDAALAAALAGVDPAETAAFERDAMPSAGVITLDSPFDFSETKARVMAAIRAQDDTVEFGVIDYRARLRDQGVDIPPTSLVLFGGPAPGARAMRKAPTLGLDAFCQKLLVWQDDAGRVKVSFNDLLALAERQGVPRNLPLRIIALRLKRTFGGALEP